MKKLRIGLIVLCLTFCLAGAVSAASVAVSIGGIDPSIEIGGFDFYFQVDPIFTQNGYSINFGNAIPSPVTAGWSSIVNLSSGLLTISNADWDYLFSSTPNPLRNGTLFTIDYTAGSIDISGWSFPDYNANYLTIAPLNLDSWKTDGALNLDAGGASPVPIPAAIYLFGAGLIGLVGVRRKF